MNDTENFGYQGKRKDQIENTNKGCVFSLISLVILLFLSLILSFI